MEEEKRDVAASARQGAGTGPAVAPNPEVPEKPRRRKYSMKRRWTSGISRFWTGVSCGSRFAASASISSSNPFRLVAVRAMTSIRRSVGSSGLAVKRRYPWGEDEPDGTRANLDGFALETVDVACHAAGDNPWGCRQLIGNVWEWTSSVFDPYPHFEPDAYRDNSEPWFGTRKVLRGGSWATQRRYVRSTFRNFFTADRRDVIAGFRTCAPHN